jgi:hypothetical protein
MKIIDLLERNLPLYLVCLDTDLMRSRRRAGAELRPEANDLRFASRVVVGAIVTSDRVEFLRWGISDALFVNRKRVRTGPPPPQEGRRILTEKQAKRVRSAMPGTGAYHAAHRCRNSWTTARTRGSRTMNGAFLVPAILSTSLPGDPRGLRGSWRPAQD